MDNGPDLSRTTKIKGRDTGVNKEISHIPRVHTLLQTLNIYVASVMERLSPAAFNFAQILSSYLEISSCPKSRLNLLLHTMHCCLSCMLEAYMGQA